MKDMKKELNNGVAWMDAPKDYKIGLRDRKLVCLNPKGKILASVPKWLKDEEIADRLLALSSWLDEHRLQCLHTAERWMLRSLTVPREIATRAWVDPDWRQALTNLVIAPSNAQGKVAVPECGILREVDAKKGLGVVDCDGETRWHRSASFAILHPILIEELEEFGCLAAELRLEQQIEQLHRPIFRPTPSQLELKALKDFEGGRFEQLNYATGHCRRLGYPVRGGYATVHVWEGDDPLEARYFVGDDYPESETWTGDLIFVDSNQRPVRIDSVGPVTFCEGVRMASSIFAKRKVEEEGESDS